MRIIQGCEDFWMGNVLPHFPPVPLGEPEAALDTIHKYAGDADKKAPSKVLDKSFADICSKYSKVSVMLQGRPLKRSTNSARI